MAYTLIVDETAAFVNPFLGMASFAAGMSKKRVERKHLLLAGVDSVRINMLYFNNSRNMEILKMVTEQDFAPLFHALGDSHRLMILHLLSSTEETYCVEEQNGVATESTPVAMTAGKIGSFLFGNKVSGSLLSYHLKELKNAGLIQELRCGRCRYYRLNRERIKTLRNFLDNLLNSDEAKESTCPCCDERPHFSREGDREEKDAHRVIF